MGDAYLEIVAREGTRKLPLSDEAVTIGRHQDNVLVIEDGEASRFHCVIEKVPEGWRVRDLDSRNGTKLNGQMMKSAIMLPGDHVTVGAVTMRIVGERVVSKKVPAAVGAMARGKNEEHERIGRDQGGMDFDAEGSIGDPIGMLSEVAESLPDKSITDADITVLNARGKLAQAPPDTTGKKGKVVEGRETVTLFRMILLTCFRLHASDLHIEPKNDFWSVRVRADGQMVDILRLNKDLGTRLTAMVKILCDIDIQYRNTVQEGRFSVTLPDRRVDYRISFAPSVYGQKLVVRVLDEANAPRYIWDLGLPDWMFKELEKAVQLDSGMVLVCGPTGSGKTTTLYSVLRSIDVGQRNVVTIEDPVEIQIEGVTQLPVNEEQGNTFAALLRSVLRQDPDAILIGEIRDQETARTAMQSAMTGHLVFSTVHAKDSVSTVFRLIDLGVEPYLVSSGLHLVVAQRLVRQLCPFCKVPVRPTEEQLKRMGKYAEGVSTLFTSRGCRRCLKTGFAGRRVVFEMLLNSAVLKEVMMKSPSPGEIARALEPTRFMTLMDTGYQLVAEGVTTLDEVERSIGA
ncbi:MAG TPA: ATPase, T2SS/T4P/T4SS family [Tepidisphaeraceae bacterium]|jgi:general secretion pathway protein E|nr:ATPase, T2SS/T4P/T4SS family [Tepidisphaeraceae bacterium]